MGAIDFCPLAKWVGEWCKSGLIAREGDHPACTGTKWTEGRGHPRDHQARRGTRRDGQALAPGGRNRPRNLSIDATARAVTLLVGALRGRPRREGRAGRASGPSVGRDVSHSPAGYHFWEFGG